VERRRAVRRSVSADEPLGQARLRTGGRLRVVEASCWGALVETTDRLLPGRHLDVHIVSAEGRQLVRCRVARAFVVKVAVDAVHYHGALSFERVINVRAEGYAVPAPAFGNTVDRGMAYPDRPSSGDIEFAESLSSEENAGPPIVASRLV
jgi:hypothetical protein